MHNLTSWLAGLPVLGWMSFAAFVLLVLFLWWKRANEPLWFDFLVAFPVQLFGHIGALKGLRRNTTNLNDQRGWRFGMSAQEKSLCDAYVSKVDKIASQKEFENKAEYLSVTGQSSVRPMRPWMWVLLAALTVGEAAGTGALISEFVSTAVTSNEIEFFTWGTALLLAAVLLGLTHFAGREQAVRATYKKILGNLDPEAVPEGYVPGHAVAFESDQFVDRGSPQAVRFFARMEKKKDRGGNGFTIAVVLGLLVVFACVFTARWYGIRQQTMQQVTQMEKSGIGAAGGPGGGTDPFGSATSSASMASSSQPVLPAVQKARQQSRDKVAKELGYDKLGQGFAATVLLSMLYLLVQGLGFFLSYEHSFFGSGAKAYAQTSGEPSYEAYLNQRFWPFATLAEARLSSLRAHYARGNETYSHATPTITFAEYFHLRKPPSDGTRPSATAAPAPTSEGPARPASQPAPDSAAQKAHPITELAASIQRQSDKAARLRRMQEVLKELAGDPEAERELKAELARLKEERDRAKLADDLSDLLED